MTISCHDLRLETRFLLLWSDLLTMFSPWQVNLCLIGILIIFFLPVKQQSNILKLCRLWVKVVDSGRGRGQSWKIMDAAAVKYHFTQIKFLKIAKRGKNLPYFYPWNHSEVIWWKKVKWWKKKRFLKFKQATVLKDTYFLKDTEAILTY